MSQGMNYTLIASLAGQIRTKHHLEAVRAVSCSEACVQLCAKHPDVDEQTILQSVLDGHAPMVQQFLIELCSQILEDLSCLPPATSRVGGRQQLL